MAEHTQTVIVGEVAELARHNTAAGPYIRVRIVDGDTRQNLYLRPEAAEGLALGTQVRLTLQAV
jgi:hypothetical protein